MSALVVAASLYIKDIQPKLGYSCVPDLIPSKGSYIKKPVVPLIGYPDHRHWESSWARSYDATERVDGADGSARAGTTWGAREGIGGLRGL